MFEKFLVKLQEYKNSNRRLHKEFGHTVKWFSPTFFVNLDS